ncbi:MAG TPA: hypothetical protein VK806_06995 [Bacteroidia bacterium]|jgi:hypothetical protein|nr:hypothetical protein [Bacteroidia bacterium]
MRKAFSILILCCAFYSASSQNFMTVIPDSAANRIFPDFVGIKLWAGDYSIKNINENVNFMYVANPYFTMKHDMNVVGLNNIPNLGLGVEEDIGKHLLINFLNISLGYIQNTWNWNLGCGIGYSESLNKSRTLRLRASANVYYEDISYRLGSYYDTTGLGFNINGVSIGQSVKNVKYVNNIFGTNLCLDLLYRRPKFDYFINVSYNYQLSSTEKINFYYTKLAVDQALYDDSGNTINGNVLNLGNYIIQIGIMRDFGL